MRSGTSPPRSNAAAGDRTGWLRRDRSVGSSAAPSLAEIPDERRVSDPEIRLATVNKFLFQARKTDGGEVNKETRHDVRLSRVATGFSLLIHKHAREEASAALRHALSAPAVSW